MILYHSSHFSYENHIFPLTSLSLGTDHAGIATQSIVEKMIMKQSNQSRHDLGREEWGMESRVR